MSPPGTWHKPSHGNKTRLSEKKLSLDKTPDSLSPILGVRLRVAPRNGENLTYALGIKGPWGNEAPGTGEAAAQGEKPLVLTQGGFV